MPVQRLGNRRSRAATDHALPHPGHDDDRVKTGHGVVELGHRTHQPHQRNRVTTADDHDLVGHLQRSDRGRIAARRVGIEDQLLVGLHGRGHIHDDEVGAGASNVEHLGKRDLPHLGPAGCARNPGKHNESRLCFATDRGLCGRVEGTAECATAG